MSVDRQQTVEWTGELPADWHHVRLGSCFVERNEPTTAEDALPLSVTKGGVVEQQELVAKSQVGAPKKLVRARDFVINSRSDRKGSAGLAPRDGSVSLINIVLKPTNIYPRFAHYLLRSGAFQEEFYRWGSGIVDDLWSTRYAAMKSILLPMPAGSVQRAIADYLDHETAEIDAFIADLQEFERLAKERTSAFVDRTLMPEEAALVSLRRLSPVRQSGTSVNAAPWPVSGEELGVLKTGVASKGWFDADENKAVIAPGEKERLTGPIIGDRVLVNRANTPELVGSAVYIPRSYPNLYLSDKLWALDFQASNAYVALALSTRHYREQVRQLSVGASTSMQNLSYEDFLDVVVFVPSRAEQGKVVERVRNQLDSDRELFAELHRAIALAKERRAALISAAVTGQIDVTAKRKPAAEQLEDDVQKLT